MATFQTLESDRNGDYEPPDPPPYSPAPPADQPTPPNPYGTQPVPGGRTGDPGPSVPGGPASFGNPVYDSIAALYRNNSGGKYEPTYRDVSQWGTNVDARYLNTIGGAIARWWQQYSQPATTPTTPTAPTQTAQQFIRAWQQAHPVSEGLAPLTEALKTAGYTNVSPYMYGTVASNNELSIDGQKYKVLGGEGTPAAYWYIPGEGDRGGSGGGGTTTTSSLAPGGSYSPTNPFDDPATKNYIDLLNSRIEALLTPQQNPQLDMLQTYLQKYFAQLQNPTYTPAQQDTIQTQTLDPLERQRQQELRNVAATMAARGITPGSGPYLQAERDINQKFDTERARLQGGFAVNEINQGREDASKAVDVGSANASLTNGAFLQQDQRANQALTDARQIPDIASQRMAQAIQLLNGSNVNPAQLLQTLGTFQKQGFDQTQADSAFWSNLIALILKNYGL